MKIIRRALDRTAPAICIAILMALFANSARADELNKETRLTFSQPIEIPGLVLAAGTYVFTVLDAGAGLVRITNADGTHVFATLLTVPEYRLEPAEKTLVTFEERAIGSPQAIKEWFYPGDTEGQEFMYWKPSTKSEGQRAR